MQLESGDLPLAALSSSLEQRPRIVNVECVTERLEDGERDVGDFTASQPVHRGGAHTTFEPLGQLVGGETAFGQEFGDPQSHGRRV